jgi:hypothetical protein
MPRWLGDGLTDRIVDEAKILLSEIGRRPGLPAASS